MKRLLSWFFVIWVALPVSLQAALTTINHSPDASNEPSLVGVNPFPGNLSPSVLETLYGEENLRRVDDSQDVAFRHTGAEASVTAVARFNNPSVQERFAFFNPTTGSWRNVLDFARVPPNFQYPVGYAVPTMGSGLIPLAESGAVFKVRAGARAASAPSENIAGQDMMVAFEIIGADGRPNNKIGNYVVGFEFFPDDDRDFQDVVYQLSGVAPVPEPATVFLWLLATFCGVGRRREELVSLK
jgi:hypothetical protein